jgi:hypothetical protein
MVLMGQFARFQVEQHEALEQIVVKDQVNVEVFRFRTDAVLSRDKREPSPEFQQKCLQIVQPGSFEIRF